jgi:sugar/nucleoside kinase (ribokinase family)
MGNVMATETYDVASLGMIVADIRARPVDRFPERGGVVAVDSMDLRLGGLAAVTATTLSRLGGRACMLGAVGDDAFGEFAMNEFESVGVETGGVRRFTTCATSTTMALVSSDGERSFIHCQGANGVFSDNDVDFGRIESSKMLHFGGTFLMASLDGPPVAAILARALTAGVITSVDTAWDSDGRWMKVVEPLLPCTDILFSSIDEARHITGKSEHSDIADVYLAGGAGLVVIKMGSDGCYLKGVDGVEYMVYAHPVTVIDTTGAGDAFVGGFLYALTRNWDRETALRFANAVGALTCSRPGGAASIRSADEVLAFMEKEV